MKTFISFLRKNLIDSVKEIYDSLVKNLEAENKRAEKKYKRDHIFIKNLSKTIDFLCNGFKKMENDLL